jgi:DNA-binding transcriptional regulator LsrR (DeoR family)
MGISQIGEDAKLYRDGFMSRNQVLELVRYGAVGEVTGWVFDAAGNILDKGTNLQVTSVPTEPGSPRLRICMGQGQPKVVALRAALTGRIINGLVTDEDTARALLSS